MIAGVINQTICTAYSHLHKEVSLTKYGVDCKKDLWKPYMVSYLLQSIEYSTCDEAYTISCKIDSLNKNLVTDKICKNESSFTDLTCGAVVVDLTPSLDLCRNKAILIQLN